MAPWLGKYQQSCKHTFMAEEKSDQVQREERDWREKSRELGLGEFSEQRSFQRKDFQ